MRARIARYVLLGVASFLIGAVWLLPAQVAAGWVEARSALSLGGVTGTAFSGHAGSVSAPGGSVDDVSWQLSPLALLVARASAQLRTASDLDGFSAQVSRSLFGTTRVSDLTGSASVGWLARLGGYTFLPVSGALDVDLKDAVFDDQLNISALDGQGRFSRVRWELVNPALKLGAFTVDVEHTDAGIHAAIADSRGPLAMDGDANVTAARRYDLDMRLRARAGADPRLKQLLNQLGPADGEGWHRVRERGRF